MRIILQKLTNLANVTMFDKRAAEKTLLWQIAKTCGEFESDLQSTEPGRKSFCKTNDFGKCHHVRPVGSLKRPYYGKYCGEFESDLQNIESGYGAAIGKYMRIILRKLL